MAALPLALTATTTSGAPPADRISTAAYDRPSHWRLRGGATVTVLSDPGPAVVAFESASPDLVEGDTNGVSDIFLRTVQ